MFFKETPFGWVHEPHQSVELDIKRADHVIVSDHIFTVVYVNQDVATTTYRADGSALHRLIDNIKALNSRVFEKV